MSSPSLMLNWVNNVCTCVAQQSQEKKIMHVNGAAAKRFKYKQYKWETIPLCYLLLEEVALSVSGSASY